MTNIIEALGETSRVVVFPVHPRTEKFLKEYSLLDRMPENIKVIQPLDPEYAEAHERRGEDTDRFRLYSEGGVCAGSAVHHAAGEYRVGG